MSKNFLFVDSAGFATEATAFETGDHINATTGGGDAAKPIITDGDGLIDSTFINEGDIDHGSIGGLSDDDHSQYTLADGTRAFSGDQSMGSNQLTSVGDPTATTIDAASADAVPMSFLASTTASEGASTIGINDTGSYFTGTEVEAALQEVAAAAIGPSYTTDGTGVTKGDLVHISANDIITKSVLATAKWSVGLALNTVGASTAGAIVTANDQILTGVLTTQTAGDTMYWNGTLSSSAIPGTSGNYVWKTGVARNASDLHVEVDFIKKNL